MSTRNTDFPIPKSELYYYDEVEKVLKPLVDTDGLMKVNIENSDIMQPIEIQGHLQTTIQTHNGVTIAPSSSNDSVFIDTLGFDKIAVTVLNNASTTSAVTIKWSHDGATVVADDSLNITNTANRKAGITDTKARYAQVSITNSDTAPHIFSAWAYLKA